MIGWRKWAAVWMAFIAYSSVSKAWPAPVFHQIPERPSETAVPEDGELDGRDWRLVSAFWLAWMMILTPAARSASCTRCSISLIASRDTKPENAALKRQATAVN